MPVAHDPTAHFAQYDIIVTLCDQDFVVPAAPAATWLLILTDEQVDGGRILPGMLDPEDQEVVEDLLLSGELSISELSTAIRNVITVASGHPWWWSLGLLSVLRGEHGTAVLGSMSRLDADRVSLANWLNALYSTLTKYMKEQDKVQLDAQLDAPPAGVEVDPEELIDEAAATATFMSMMRGTNG